MKRLLMVSNRTQLFRGISASALAVLACVLFSFAFRTADAAKNCQICHRPRGNPEITLSIHCKQVAHHLRNHPNDCEGPCPCEVTDVRNP